jgi:hypothetical protein
VGWTTIVVLAPHQRPGPGTAGFPASGL